MYAFEEESMWSKVAEIGTWVLLFVLLVPGTAFGFFAENSLPNSPLYPVKRDIEAVILALVSVNNGTKSAYELSLANTRFNETKQLIASNTPLTPQQLNTVTVQLAAAQTSINSISDSVQKAQLQQQLHTTVNAYQTQIAQLQQQLQNAPETTSPVQQPPQQDTAQPTTTQPAQVQQTTNPAQPIPTQQTTAAGIQTGQSIQPSPTQATSTTTSNTQNLTPEQRQALEEQLQQLQDQLQNFQDQNQPTQDQQIQQDHSQKTDH